MKILFIADIIGEPGRAVLHNELPKLIEREQPDFIIANAENAAGGKGITKPIADELFAAGIHVLTMGNHTFDRKEIKDIIDHPAVLRPANYPPAVDGNGWGVFNAKNNVKLAVLSLMGRVYLPDIDCPFRTANAALEDIYKETQLIIVDFHAEVTSEKQAMGWYLDGRVSAMIGTHTHIPTADEQVLPGGTAYITDAGMTGPTEGVIGMDREIVIKKYLTGIPHHFVVAKGAPIMQGCILEIDPSSSRAQAIRRFTCPEQAGHHE